MLTLYCDRSELLKPARIVVVSGVLSDLEHWTQVEAAWCSVLQRFGVGRFHMTDFEARQQEFKGWSNERRIEFLDSLIGALEHRVVAGFSCAILLDDYDQLDGPDREIIRHPYAFCGGFVIAHVFRFVDRYLGNDKSVAFVLEDGDEGRGILLDQLSRRRLGPLAGRVSSISFADCRELLPLQAADLVAYESAKAIARHATDEQRQPRKSLQRLLAAVPLLYSGHFRLRGLRDVAAENRAINLTLSAVRSGTMTPDEAANELARRFPSAWPDLLAEHEPFFKWLSEHRKFLRGHEP
jgi:hypothetical protein